MPPKKAPAAAKENVSLGPLAGDGMFNKIEAHLRLSRMSNE